MRTKQYLSFPVVRFRYGKRTKRHIIHADRLPHLDDNDDWWDYWFTIGTRTFACSLYGVPHNYPKGDTISTNNFKGQVCIHFTNSKTHNSNKVDSGHVEAIDYAWQQAPNGHK